MSTHTFLVAPIGTGKTTFLKQGAVAQIAETDQARDPATEPTLKRLRHHRDWDEHNAIWHRQIRLWSEKLAPGTTILAHSFADARAMGATPRNTVAVLLPYTTWWAQVLQSKDAKTQELARLNRETVVREADSWRLPVARSWSDPFLTTLVKNGAV